MLKPSLSVVVPAYRHERFVGEALDSVGAQTLQPAEVVVVDDGSPDRTAEIVEARPEGWIRLLRQENRGAHEALDRAIGEAGGEWIAILNSDDRYLPGHLEASLGWARATGSLLLSGSLRLIDETGAPLDPHHPTAGWYATAVESTGDAQSGRALSSALRRHNVVGTTSNFFLHRSLWEALGGFSAYRYVHDLDFLLRSLDLAPGRVRFEPRLTGVEYRVHGSNTISEDVQAALAERAELFGAMDRPLSRLRRSVRRPLRRRWLPSGDALRRTAVTAPAAAGDSDEVRTGRRERAGPGSVGRRGPTGPRLGMLVRSLDEGGLEEVVALLTHGLRARGFPCSVLCTEAGGAVAERLREAGVDVTSGRGDPLRWRRWAERTEPEVILSHFGDAKAVERLADLAPVIEVVHNCYAWLGADGWAEEAHKAARSTRIVAVSKLVATYFTHRVSATCPPIEVIPNGVDPTRCTRVPRELARQWLEVGPNDHILAHLGRIAEQKNLGGLLRAFEDLLEKEPEALLLLAGPVTDRHVLSALREEHARLFASGRVRHLGPVHEVGVFLSAADLYLSNSFFEGWSVSASEALWVGTPVVLSECGGAAELVGSDGARGRLVPNPLGDPLSAGPETLGRFDQSSPDAEENRRAMVEAVTELLAEGHSEDAGDRQRLWARAHLGPDRLSDAYARLIRRTADGR